MNTLPIKVALVSNTSWSIYNFRLGLIRTLKALGAEVLLIAPKDPFSAQLIAEGFSYEPMQMDNYGKNPLNDWQTTRTLRRIYQKHQPDFIFHYTIKPNIYGSIAASRCRIPSIAITTGLGRLFSYKNPLVRLAAHTLYQYASHLSQQVWFLNQSDKDTFLARGIAPTHKAFLLPSEGINTQHFSPTLTIRKNLPNTFHFLYAGRIIWDKGLKEYAEAARIIRLSYPKATFHLLGFTDPKNPNSVPLSTIQQWHQEGTVKYLGETVDVRPHLAKADCIVFPSYYREGVSRILMEAASMAKPIITTHNVGCQEVVEHGYNGLLCQPRNTQSLVNQIQAFMALPASKRQKMGYNGRQKVQTLFDERVVIKHYIQFLAQYFGLTIPELPAAPTRQPIKRISKSPFAKNA